MKKIILQSLTKSINAYLGLDPESKQRLKNLCGKAITIELLPLSISFQCLFTETGIHVQDEDASLIPDAKLRGTPIQMLGVLLTKDNRQHFFADDLVIEGNAEFGQDVVELFDAMQIDWEEYLSHLVGDVPAHQVGRLVKRMTSWLGVTEKSLAQAINEYIHEEAKWLPTHEALQDFFAEIDNLRMDVDRMEVRINRLSIQDEVKQ